MFQTNLGKCHLYEIVSKFLFCKIFEKNQKMQSSKIDLWQLEYDYFCQLQSRAMPSNPKFDPNWVQCEPNSDLVGLAENFLDSVRFLGCEHSDRTQISH